MNRVSPKAGTGGTAAAMALKAAAPAASPASAPIACGLPESSAATVACNTGGTGNAPMVAASASSGKTPLCTKAPICCAAPMAASRPMAVGALLSYAARAPLNSNSRLVAWLSCSVGSAAVAAIWPKRPLRIQMGSEPSNPPTAALASVEFSSTLESLVLFSSSLTRSPAVSVSRSFKS